MKVQTASSALVAAYVMASLPSAKADQTTTNCFTVNVSATGTATVSLPARTQQATVTACVNDDAES